MKTHVETKNDEAVIVMTRTFDAPREVVWRAFTQPASAPHPTTHMTITLEDAGPRTHWTLVARWGTLEEREMAMRMGFTHVLLEGVDRFDDLAKRLASQAISSAPI